MSAYSQKWSIHFNGNETYPINNEALGYYPILWYSSADDRGVLVGGFGAGASYTKLLDLKVDQVKYQFNVQRARFYDWPFVFRDVNGALLGAYIGVNTNVNVSAFALPQFKINKKRPLYLGAGFGFRGVLYSKTNYGTAYVNGQETTLKLKNTSMSRFVLFFPVEMSWQKGRWNLATRGELSINSTSRLSANSKERSVVVFGEIGYFLFSDM